MKKQPAADSPASSGGTRRKVLKAIAAAVPAAGLPGCKTSPEAQGGAGEASQTANSAGNATHGPAKNKAVSPAKQGQGKLSGNHNLPPWVADGNQSDAVVCARTKWDFEKFIARLLEQLESGEMDTSVNAYAKNPRGQNVQDPDRKQRNLNIHMPAGFEIQFAHETDNNGQEYVAGFIVRGEMGRGHHPGVDWDVPMDPDPNGIRCDGRSAFLPILTEHSVYNSSSSSSSWGVR